MIYITMSIIPHNFPLPVFDILLLFALFYLCFDERASEHGFPCLTHTEWDKGIPPERKVQSRRLTEVLGGVKQEDKEKKTPSPVSLSPSLPVRFFPVAPRTKNLAGKS
jgi:hypothetical protein